jgi:hypothetical protein
MPGAEDLQEVNSALPVRAFKPGEEFIADVGTVAIFTIRARPGIIDVDVTGNLKPGGQQGVFFSMKKFFIFNQEVAEFSRGDLHPPFQ